jgi:hypothetical protein
MSAKDVYNEEEGDFEVIEVEEKAVSGDVRDFEVIDVEEKAVGGDVRKKRRLFRGSVGTAMAQEGIAWWEQRRGEKKKDRVC